MISQDVIHSFFVPAFRIKQDVLPRRYTSIWFKATNPGHVSPVLRRILRHRTLADDRLDLRDGSARLPDLAPAGRSRGLARIHGRKVVPPVRLRQLPSLQRTRTVGRISGVSTRGRFRSKAAKPSSPTKPTFANRSWSREPKSCRDFQPIMPTFQGQLSEEQVTALIAYIKAIGPAPGARNAIQLRRRRRGDYGSTERDCSARERTANAGT